MAEPTDTQIKLRLPAELKCWIDEESAKNRSSKSSEIVRSIRERKDRLSAAQRKEPTP